MATGTETAMATGTEMVTMMMMTDSYRVPLVMRDPRPGARIRVPRRRLLSGSRKAAGFQAWTTLPDIVTGSPEAPRNGKGMTA